MAGEDIIERCAKIADDAVATLDAVLATPARRRSQYDKQTAIQIRYARRWCKRIAANIRKLDPSATLRPENDLSPLVDGALRALRDLKPIIEGSAPSAWRSQTLQRINALLDQR